MIRKTTRKPRSKLTIVLLLKCSVPETLVQKWRTTSGLSIIVCPHGNNERVMASPTNICSGCEFLEEKLEQCHTCVNWEKKEPCVGKCPVQNVTTYTNYWCDQWRTTK